MEYHFKEIEKRWQQYWAEHKIFRALNPDSPEFLSSQFKGKYYVLDMFPYPSGAGLHVGHPLGYIASDIVARYKRHCGYNVLHPMGYDSFGLPAEQYAIQTGLHPGVTTENNINRYREQLDKIGFSYDWDREVRTSDPDYYKWTQWIFLKLFNSWYNPATDQAEPLDTLLHHLKNCKTFPGQEATSWELLTEKQKSDILMSYRLAYLSESWVNWCPALGTVLANEEVKDGVSERGGYPVERKQMPQWSLRITAFADRLLRDLDQLQWSESLKDAQRNWIGKSVGSSLTFEVEGSDRMIEVFTTRPDTVFGVSFLTLAPESELVEELTAAEFADAIRQYVQYARNRNERERQADVKKITGQFTGSFAIHPFTGEKIPVWVGEYVLAGYGTGAVMGVPAHDSRDYAFAKHFNLEIRQVIEPPVDFKEEVWEEKSGTCINSGFLNGLEVSVAIQRCIEEIEKNNIGKGKTNYRLRDAIFGRQRYWGEPIPVYYKDGIPVAVNETDLPICLPEIDKYLPTETGEPPLARAKDWYFVPGRGITSASEDKNGTGGELELTTMPGWAGSSWYYLRFMDARNNFEFASRQAVDYWKEVDLYIGGSEHATGHLLYFRFWTKFLHDLGYLSFSEPALRLINQGMIQGTSSLVYRINGTNKFVSAGLRKDFETTPIHIDIRFVHNHELNIEQLRNWRDEFANAEFILENGKYICGSEVEKMSKRWHNVVNPDDICESYGADCLRMYEMFLGPLEQHKPWNTNGISGVFSFLKKFWRFYQNSESDSVDVAALKVLHRTIKKITNDIEHYSFNTAVSAFMICINELTEIKCYSKKIFEPLCILIAPFAPHLAEELWYQLGNRQSISFSPWPEFDEKYLEEDSFDYPVSINGKTKFKIPLSLKLNKQEVEQAVLSSAEIKKYTEYKSPKKVIVVPGRIVNVVV
ncbi:MAG: leucine--tRNA ligase [Bacteroidia bacterium]|nr:leucine--tRNA ligase [Bacteroidia bacterium]MCZ2277906.1 leucine--tRNA ligase [Bacteroidia bacterium]